MILRMVIGIGIGAALGALMGSTRSCETGGCPLTATPWRGGIYGGVMGLLFALSLAAPAASPPTAAGSTGAGRAQASNTETEALRVVALAADDFDAFASDGTVLIDFWSPLCGPCRRQLPILNEVRRQAPEDVRIGKVDLTEHPGLAQRFGVRVVPTLVLLHDGEEMRRFVGLQPAETLLAALDKGPSEHEGGAYD